MNTKFALVAALGALSLATIVPQAAAADNGFYLGAGITKTEFDLDGDGFGSESLDDNSFKIIAGFRPLDWLAVEANYIDLGGDSGDGFDLDTTAITVSALLLAEVGIVDFYGRLGMANFQTDVDIDGLGDFSDDSWEPTYGVGIGAHFGSIGVRAEYEMFSAELFDQLDSDVSTISLSVTYTFL
jgi:outer membrane protein with beta-barrel domain